MTVANTRTEKKFIFKKEYFKMLVASEHKIEYDNGKIMMMAGGSQNHTTIVDNTFFNLRANQSNCRAWSSETAVSIESLGKYYFPDAMIVCGDDSKFNENASIARLLNPRLVVEVVSETSSDRDRVEKFRAYCQLESFKEYLLIDSRSYLIDVFYRE